MTNYDLDVDVPEKVSGILRCVAQAYYESSSELQSAWQDRYAGQEWIIIAKELERCATRIDAKLGNKQSPVIEA
jgi:hypothetical protein